MRGYWERCMVAFSDGCVQMSILECTLPQSVPKLLEAQGQKGVLRGRRGIWGGLEKVKSGKESHLGENASRHGA